MQVCATKLEESSGCDLDVGSCRVVHHPVDLEVQEFISMVKEGEGGREGI